MNEHFKGTVKVAAISIVRFWLSLTSWKRIFYSQQHAGFDVYLLVDLDSIQRGLIMKF